MLNFQHGVSGIQNIVVFVKFALDTENKNMAVRDLGQFTVKVLVETLSLVVTRLPAKQDKNGF